MLKTFSLKSKKLNKSLTGQSSFIMPIEIRELHIKVSVTDPQSGQASTGKESPARGGGDSPGNDKEGIVAACVEKVMEILQNKTER